MREDFDGARQILLEENYRSTAGILNYGTAIINQDAERIQKKLISMRGAWSTPYQREFSDRENEVSFVAKEIKRVKHGFGLSWSDICILLRYNADSRMLETALAKEGIPSRVLNGRKFFQRAEVMISAALRLAAQPPSPSR
jgi:DNA helicase-2/ATP-dependent DNA helicase PcrA